VCACVCVSTQHKAHPKHTQSTPKAQHTPTDTASVTRLLPDSTYDSSKQVWGKVREIRVGEEKVGVEFVCYKHVTSMLQDVQDK